MPEEIDVGNFFLSLYSMCTKITIDIKENT